MRILRFFTASSSLALVATLAGCGSDVTSPSGNGVAGTAVDTYDPGGLKTDVPVEPDYWTQIKAISGDKGHPGFIDDEGVLSIPNVPEGPYLLALTYPPGDIPGELGSTYFQHETARELDLGTLHSHRPDLDVISQPTFVTITAPLTVPWQRLAFDDQGNVTQALEDELDLLSRGADVTGQIAAYDDDPTQSGAPADGDTALTGWKIDASYAFGGYSDGKPHLVRADRNDDFTVVHRVMTQVGGMAPPSTDSWDDYRYTSAAEVLRPASFTMTDGGNVNLDGAFEALPQKQFTLDYRGSEIQKLFADAPTQKLYASYLYVGVYNEYGSPAPAVGGIVPLLDAFVYARNVWDDPTCNPDSCDPVQCAAGCPSDHTLAFPGDQKRDYPYGNPAGSGQELATVGLYFRIRVDPLLPGDTTPESLRGSLVFDAPAAELSGTPVQPTLGLPRNIQVNAAPAPVDVVTAGVGTTPTISFQAPSLGTPERYILRIVALDDIKNAAGEAVLTNEGVVGFSVPASQTSVKIPDGFLKTGKHYYVQVTARIDGRDPASPLRLQLRSVSAMSFSGIVTP